MKKTYRILICVALVLALGLCSCGNEGGTETSSALVSDAAESVESNGDGAASESAESEDQSPATESAESQIESENAESADSAETPESTGGEVSSAEPEPDESAPEESKVQDAEPSTPEESEPEESAPEGDVVVTAMWNARDVHTYGTNPVGPLWGDSAVRSLMAEKGEDEAYLVYIQPYNKAYHDFLLEYKQSNPTASSKEYTEACQWMIDGEKAMLAELGIEAELYWVGYGKSLSADTDFTAALLATTDMEWLLEEKENYSEGCGLVDSHCYLATVDGSTLLAYLDYCKQHTADTCSYGADGSFVDNMTKPCGGQVHIMHAGLTADDFYLALKLCETGWGYQVRQAEKACYRR